MSWWADPYCTVMLLNSINLSNSPAFFTWLSNEAWSQRCDSSDFAAFWLQNGGSEVLCAGLWAESWPVDLAWRKFLTGTCLCIQHSPLAWSPDFKKASLRLVPLFRRQDLQKYLLLIGEAWIFDLLWWMFCCLGRLSLPRFDWPTPTMWPKSDWRASHATEVLVHVGGVVSGLIKCKMDETKVIYHIDDEDTPYLVKLPKSPTDVTLSDFKNVLNRPSYKFFFKSMDDDFGWVCVPWMYALYVDSFFGQCLRCFSRSTVISQAEHLWFWKGYIFV